MSTFLKMSRPLPKFFKELFQKYSFHPSRRLGQNFLIDKDVLDNIIKAAELNKNDIVLEIGPGLGVLTKELSKRAKRVIAVEKDKKLVKILKEKLARLKNIEIIEGDILRLTTDDLQLTTGYKVVANLPYYITSPVTRKFLEGKRPPRLMVLMVQKEVAERICAKPPRMTLLSAAVQFYSHPEIVKIVKKECFWPKPKVDSAIIRIANIREYKCEFSRINPELFFSVVRAGFTQPRKQLKNNLKRIFNKDTEGILKKSKIEGTRRAETLSINDWIKICLTFKNTLK